MKKQQRFEILLEEVRDVVRTVAEGHGTLQRQIVDLRGEMNERFKGVDLKFEALNGKIDEVDHRLGGKIDEVDRRLGAKIDHVATELAEHRADTEAHAARNVG